MARPKRPAPLTPPDSDLRALPDMPMDVKRLGRSRMLQQPGEVFRAAFTLWCMAWHENPAGSIPADDFALASRLGYRATPEAWISLKERALAGFVLCSDGRYYHRIISELALEAWGNYLRFKRRSAAANASKYHNKFDPAEIDGQIAAIEKYREALKKISVPGETYDGLPASDTPSRSEQTSRSMKEHTKPGAPLLEGGNGISSRKRDTQSQPLPIRKGQGTSSTAGDARSRKRASAPAGEAKGMRLPFDWFPSPELRALGAELGFSEREVDEISDEFRDYWSAKPGADGRKLDWDATWRNWIRKERRHRNGRGNGTGVGRRPSSFDTEALGPMHAGFVAAVNKAGGQRSGG